MPPAEFPADWREKAAGEDKTFLDVLKRYGSVNDAFKAMRELQLKISAGELKAPAKPLGADATPEQVAAWRKEQGLPEKAEDFIANLKLPDGIVPGEADKPLLGAVAAMAMKGGYDQKTVNDFVGFHYQLQNQLLGQRAEADQEFRATAEQQLRVNMGDDFKPNMRAAEAFWQEAPAGIKDVMLSARTPDGRVLGNLPEVTEFIVKLSRELNPAATLLPPGTDGTPQSIAARKAAIEGQMYIDGKQNPAYFGGPLHKEYRDLLEAEERIKSRAA